MKRQLFFFATILLCGALVQAQPHISGPVDTMYFKQADFEWHVSPRHDYSRTLMGKLFMSQAHWDEQFKLHDNGKQTNYMNCDDALDAIIAMDNITLSLPKIIYLVGWQYNGHDSKYPAFFECNEAVRSPGDASAYESVIRLIEDAKKYNTAVSFHINMFNCYDDSPLFEKYKEDDVLARYSGGDYIHSDWGWSISYARDWATGNAQARLDKLCELFPVAESGTLHIDAFHSSIPVPVVEGSEVVIRYISPISPYHNLTKQDEIDAQLNIIKYLDAKGIDVTSEYCPEEAFVGYMPAVWHKHERYLYLTRTEKQMGHTNAGTMGNVFGRNVNPESAFKDTEGTLHDKAVAFKKEFCKSSLPYFYLSCLTPIAYIKSKDCDDASAFFTEGVSTYYVDGSFSLYKDGIKLADGGDIFIPARWAGDNIVVAYSEEGYEDITWTLPAEIKPKGRARVFIVDSDGEHYAGTVKVRGGKITLSLGAGEMFKIEL